MDDREDRRDLDATERGPAHAAGPAGTTRLSTAAAVESGDGSAVVASGPAAAAGVLGFGAAAGPRGLRLSGPGPDASNEPPSPSGVPTVDDELWSTSFGAIGVAAYPSAIAVHGDEVYLGGTFTLETAGLPSDTFVRVARWDGSRWHRMGDGVDAAVHAIVVAGSDVYVGGEFSTAGGTPAARLARWDGTAWSEVAGGVDSGRSWSTVAVRALASDGTRLWVAGTFDVAGSGDGRIEANGLASLHLGTGAWESPDGGLRFLSDPGEGRALSLAGDRLLVGGSFDHAGTVETASIAALDVGTGTWTAFGPGVRNGDFTGTVDALAVDAAGTVYVGGRFTAAGDAVASGVATLVDGRFGSLGAFTYYGDPGGAHVVALAHAGGRLYAAGEFTTAGDVEAQHWAAYDGTGWRVPAGLDNSVAAMAAYGEQVVVTGMFEYCDALRLPHAGIWTGARWQTFGQGLGHDPYSNVFVYALVATDEAVYAGGFFDQAGPLRVASVAQWRDEAWHDLAGGVQSPHVLGEVFAMLQVGSDLYVTGQFETAGGVAASNIARWDGAGWSPLGGGLPDGTGYALTVLGGRLYVGGALHLAGDVRVSNVACWDPATGTWSAVGSVPTYDGDVFSLAALDDRYLVVGGYFTKLWAGRFQVSGLNSIVLFDTHAPPRPADPWAGYSRVPGLTRSGLPGVVSALQVLGDDLYVGGAFDTAGVEWWSTPPVAGFPASNLATWHYRAQDGSWSAPGVLDRPVKALTTLGDHALVIGGGFGSAGGTEASGVVEHDPVAGSWTPYGSGIGWGARGVRQVEALAQSSAAGLWVAGTFTVAGTAPSCGLALWRGTAAPRQQDG